MTKTIVTRARVEGLVIVGLALAYVWQAHQIPDLFQMPGVPGPTAFPMLVGTVFGLGGLWRIFAPSKIAEVEKLADRVTIIREGATVEAGTIAELRHLTRSTMTVAVDHGVDGLAALPGVHDVRTEDGHVSFAVDDAELPAVLAVVAALRPRSLVANPPSLEELFLRHYGDELAALSGGDR